VAFHPTDYAAPFAHGVQRAEASFCIKQVRTIQ
jgi:hypothetical protein